jgi:hypothetical protein
MLAFALRYIAIGRAVRTISESEPVFDPRLRVLYGSLAFAVAGLQCAALTSAFFDWRPFFLLFLGLLWGLFCGAFGFVRLLFVRPVRTEEHR